MVSPTEQEMTRRFWDTVGGTLVEEYPIVPRTPMTLRRAADGVILTGRRREIVHWSQAPSLDGEDVVVVQTKAYRAGLHLVGQAALSPRLVDRRWRPRSLRSVAVHTECDPALSPILARMGIEERVLPASARPPPIRLPRMGRDALRRFHRWVGGEMLVDPWIVPGRMRAEAVVVRDRPVRELDLRHDARPLAGHIAGQEVTVLATLGGTLGMSTAGEVVFGAELLRAAGAASVRGVALVRGVDPAIAEALRSFPGMDAIAVTD